MDADAAAYISAVETADTESLEGFVKNAIDAFVVGCKADSIWTPIKASCLLAGPRTLAGALVPLVGSAPTNVSGNFVSGDYNRLTGLKGDGSTKLLSTNRNNNAEPQNSRHMAIWISEANTLTANNRYIAAGDSTNGSSYIVGRGTPDNLNLTSSSSANFSAIGTPGNTTGFVGISRSTGGSFSYRVSSTDSTASNVSQSPLNETVHVFGRPGESPLRYADGRLAFYSIGEALTLSSLQSRLAAYLFAIANPPEGNPIAFRKRLLQRRGLR
jgi:hypothetical protein